jgi:hypothetical protein
MWTQLFGYFIILVVKPIVIQGFSQVAYLYTSGRETDDDLVFPPFAIHIELRIELN